MEVPNAVCPNRTNSNNSNNCSCPKLLIVDDSDANVFVLQGYCSLKSIPYDVVFFIFFEVYKKAHGGKEAVELAEKRHKNTCCSRYRLILMDINMPVVDGIMATAQIRKMETEVKRSNSKIVALTAADTEKGRLREEYEILGFNELVSKPLSRKEFNELIARYIV